MVLMYHNVGAERRFNTVSLQLFEQQIEYIARNYEVVGVDEYIDHIQRTGEAKAGQAIITFDDAYEGYQTCALPVLSRLNLPSTVFVCTGYIGKANEWDAAERRSPIMDETAIKTIAKHPLVTIGSHTVNHYSLTLLDKDRLEQEIKAAKVFLETLLGNEIKYFSYPYGQPYLDLNRKIIQAVAQAGFTAAFSTNFKNTNNRDVLFSLNRLDITPADEMDAFKKKLSKHSFYYYKQRVKNVYSFLKKQTV